jgi:preprotein translocase subunit SecE
MIHTLIYVLVVCIVIGLVWWVADWLPIPEPLNKLVKLVSVVIGVIVIIYALLGIAGMAPGLA